MDSLASVTGRVPADVDSNTVPETVRYPAPDSGWLVERFAVEVSCASRLTHTLTFGTADVAGPVGARGVGATALTGANGSLLPQAVRRSPRQPTPERHANTRRI
jgi:hypothetical protein